MDWRPSDALERALPSGPAGNGCAFASLCLRPSYHIFMHFRKLLQFPAAEKDMQQPFSREIQNLRDQTPFRRWP